MTIDEILAALKAIVDTASADNDRDLTDEEMSRYEELEAQLATVRRSQEIRSRQTAYETPAGVPALHTASSTKGDTLERAFNHYLRTGQANSDIVELRAQGEGVGTEGGYLVPDGFRQKMVDRMVAFGGIAAVADSFDTGNGNPLSYPTLDDTGNSGEIVAEAGTFSAGADLVFGQTAMGAYKYMAGGGSSTPLRVSVELLQDASFDVEALVAAKLGQRIGRIQAQHLVNGTGTAQPKGLVHGKTGIKLADDTAGVTYDDLLTFIHSVDPAYREGGNCRWAFNDASLKVIRQIKDSNGDPIWRPLSADMGTGLGGGELLGYPVTIDQAFLDLDVDSKTVNWGAFGDIQAGYVIRRVKDVTIIVNPWTRAANGQVEFTAWARMDAAPQDTNAYVALTGEAP